MGRSGTMTAVLYPFRYRSPLTGRWINARYKATREDIAADHAEWEVDIGRDIDHRRRRLGELEHRHVLGCEPAHVGDPGSGRGDRGDQVERRTGVPGPAPCQGVGPDHRPGRGVEPHFIVGWHGASQTQPGSAAVRALTRMCSLERLTMTAIS